MSRDVIRTLRLSETVTPFGVGAIVDIDGDSLIAMDTGWWPKVAPAVECRRLEEALGASALKSAPSVPSYPGKKTPGLQYRRFPGWLFCERCRRMSRLTPKSETGKKPECAHCHGHLVPMRFVAVCRSNSHIEDIPWPLWTHRAAETDAQKRCQSSSGLEFKTSKTGNESLGSLSITCKDCGTRRSLGALSRQGSLKADGFRCMGRQPWQSADVEAHCEADLEAVQRGATNVHFAEVESALDIPEARTASEILRSSILEHAGFELLASDPDGPVAEPVAMKIAEDTGATPEVVLSVARHAGGPAPDLLIARRGLRDGEWAAFHSDEDYGEVDPSRNFVIEPSTVAGRGASTNAERLASLVPDLVLVQRLREVRAMHAFKRYAQEANSLPVNLEPAGRIRRPWFPAIETFGEGIFFALDESRVRAWEKRYDVAERFAQLEVRRAQSKLASRFDPVAPRLILVHTLAHLLMRRLAFDSGYASASLRERIYSSSDPANPQAGILIYTSAGDVEGTLGGLVRQGQPPRFARTLLRSVEDADWCSNDPLCRESRGQGMNALNLAACHGCCLAPETSCESGNLFLDRRALLNEGSGFFDGLLETVRGELAQAAL